MFIPALVLGTWLGSSNEALDVAVPKEEQQALLQTRFENYYSSAPAAEFSTRVLVNNIQVSFLAFALGVFLCVGTAAILFYNGINVGVAEDFFSSNAHQIGKFFGFDPAAWSARAHLHHDRGRGRTPAGVDGHRPR